MILHATDVLIIIVISPASFPTLPLQASHEGEIFPPLYHLAQEIPAPQAKKKHYCNIDIFLQSGTGALKMQDET